MIQVLRYISLLTCATFDIDKGKSFNYFLFMNTRNYFFFKMKSMES